MEPLLDTWWNTNMYSVSTMKRKGIWQYGLCSIQAAETLEITNYLSTETASQLIYSMNWHFLALAS